MYFQYVKFIVVGSMNTLVSFFIFFICYALLQYSYFISLVISYAIGILNSYFWNSLWTFGVKRTDIKSLIKFISVYIITFILNLFIVFILVDVYEVGVLVSQGFSLFVVSAVSFVAHKYWSFKIKEIKRNEVCIDK